MFQRLSILIVVAVCCVQVTSATIRYHVQRLANIARATNLQLPDGMTAGLCDDSTYMFRGRPLSVRTNSFGDVSHIGYRLFSPHLIEAYGSLPILLFIERYLLELDLELDGRTPTARMDIDKVVIAGGDINWLHSMAGSAAFSIETIKRRMYRLKWTDGGRTFSITVPADGQLLTGADAIELEDVFERDLQRITPMSSDAMIGNWLDAPISRSGDMLITDGGSYLSEMIRADVFLTEQNGCRNLVMDAAWPRQSITNIMLTGCYTTPIPMNLTLDRYGNKQTKVTVTVQQFVNYCLVEGCQLYFGIKTHDEGIVTGTLFALNEELAYNHVLSISFPTDIIRGSSAEVKGTVYTYIPLQNVTEIFFNQDLK